MKKRTSDNKKPRVNRKAIKRCPHCDSYFAPPVVIWRSVTARWWEPRYNLECQLCYWNSAKAYTPRGAIRKWNRDRERARRKA